MEINLVDIISVVITSIVIPLIVFLGQKLNAYLKTKTENEKLKKYIDSAINAVTIAVVSTTQTYVDTLKAKGEFTPEAQKEAFERAKFKALTLITQDAKNALEAIYGDFNEWLTNQIETTVKESK